MSAADRLEADAIQAAMRGQFFGSRVLVLDETTSTNDVVMALAAQSPEGLVVFAERQTAGRGQHGKQWESAAGKGLWFSILLRPPLPPDEAHHITTWAAATVAATLSNQFSLGAIVKPPNDVCVGGKKVAGVLLEMRAVPGAPHLGVLGLGINVKHTAADFPEEVRNRATSIAMLTEEEINRQELAIQLLGQLNQTYVEDVLRAAERRQESSPAL